MNYELAFEWTRWAEPWDPEDANADVSVTMPDGAEYSATFFTVRNVTTLMNRWRDSGACAGGRYFWAVHAIIVQRLDETHVRAAVDDLLATGAFGSAFAGPHPPSEDDTHR